jgi:hypothetical protein
LEWRWRIPRKTNDKGWRELEAKVARDAAVIVPRRRRAGERMVAKLDEKIANVEKQRDSAKKTTTIRKLRNERTETFNRYA